eukprot:Partr_v1_DN28760_c0_g1_i1_m62101 putative RhoGEF
MARKYRPGTNLLVVANTPTGGMIDELAVSIDNLVVVVDQPANDKRKDQIYVINRSLGPNNGQVGWVPLDSVQYQDDNNDTNSKEQQDDDQSSEELEFEELPSHGDITRKATEEQVLSEFEDEDQVPAVTSTSTPKHLDHEQPPGTKVICRFEYQATKSDELDLKVDDIVVVLESPPGGWWRGMAGFGKLQRAGWFPANLVEVDAAAVEVETPSPLPQPQQHSDSSSSKHRTSWYKKLVGKGEAGRSRSNSVDARPESQNMTPVAVPVENKRESMTSGSSSRTSSPSKMVEMAPWSELEPESHSWRDFIDASILDELSAREVKRQDIIWELLITEKSYLADLDLLDSAFGVPLREKKILNVKHINAIFGNLSHVTAANKSFLKRLEGRWMQDHLVQEVGDIFLETANSFMCYAPYCSERASALEKIESLMNSNKTFNAFLKAAYDSGITHNLDLSSYLIKPPQRICKYPLLLKELLKVTEVTHPDRANLEEAFLKMHSVITIINQGPEHLESTKRMTEIQASLQDKIRLLAPDRYLVREDTTYVVQGQDAKQPRRLILFNDSIMIAKKDWRDKFHVVTWCKFEQCQVTDVSLETGASIILTASGDATGGVTRPTEYFLTLNSKQAKAAWLASLNKFLEIRDAIKKTAPQPESVQSHAADHSYDNTWQNVEMDIKAVASHERLTLSTQALDKMISTEFSFNVQQQDNSGVASTANAGSNENVNSEGSNSTVASLQSHSSMRSSAAVNQQRKSNSTNQAFHLQVELPEAVARSFSDMNAVSKARAKSLYGKLASTSAAAIQAPTEHADQDKVDDVYNLTLASLRSRIQDQEKIINSQTIDNERLTLRLTETERINADLMRQNSEQAERFMNIASDGTTLQRQLMQLQSHIADLEASRKLDSDNFIAQLEGMRKDRESLIQQIDVEKAQSTSKFEKEISAITAKHLAEVSRVKSDAEHTIAEFKATIGSLQSKSSQQAETIGRLENEKSQISSHKDTGAPSVVSYESIAAEKGSADMEARFNFFKSAYEAAERTVQEEKRLNMNFQEQYRAEKEKLISDFIRNEANRDTIIRDKSTIIERKDLELLSLRSLLKEKESASKFSVGQIETLRREVARKNDIIQSNQEILSENERKFARQKFSSETDQEQISKLNRQISDLQLDSESLRIKIKDLTDVIARITVENQDQQAVLADTTADLKAAATQNAIFQEMVHAADMNIEELREVETEFHSLKKVNQDLLQEVDRLFKVEEAYESLTEKHSELERSYKSLEESLEILKSQLDLDSSTIQKNLEIISKASTDTKVKELEIARLTDALSAKSKELETSVQMLKMTKEVVSDLENVRDGHESELESFRTKMKAALVLKKRLKKTEADNLQANNELKLLRAEIEARTSELQNTRRSSTLESEKLSAAQKTIKQLEGEIKLLGSQFHEKTTECESMNIIFHDLEKIVEVERKSNDVIRSEAMLNLVEVIYGLKMQKENLTDELTAIKTQFEDLENINIQMDQEMQTVLRTFKDLEEKAESQKLKYEDIIESHISDNASLVTQMKKLMESKDEVQHRSKEEAEIIEALQERFVACQKELIGVQVENASLVEEFQNQDNELAVVRQCFAGQQYEIYSLKESLRQMESFKKTAEESAEEITRIRGQNFYLKKALYDFKVGTLSINYDESETQLHSNLMNISANNETSSTLDDALESLMAPNTKDPFSRSLPIPERSGDTRRQKQPNDRYSRYMGNCMQHINSMTQLNQNLLSSLCSVLILSDTETSAAVSLFAMEASTKIDNILSHYKNSFTRQLELLSAHIDRMKSAVEREHHELLVSAQTARHRSDLFQKHLTDAVRSLEELRRYNEMLNRQLREKDQVLERNRGDFERLREQEDEFRKLQLQLEQTRDELEKVTTDRSNISQIVVEACEQLEGIVS